MGRKRKGRKVKRGGGWRSVTARANPLLEAYYRRQLAPLLESFPETSLDVDGTPMTTAPWDPADEAPAGAADGERKKGEKRTPSSVLEARSGPPLPERAEAGFQAMLATLRTRLPCSWRVFSGSPVASKVLADLEAMRSLPVEPVPEGASEEDARLASLRAKPLPWYPDGLAFQIACSRDEMRKNPSLKKLHRFLVKNCDTGDVWRQETVSMVPALVLDVQSHHRVLDMCAAPGSKTAQLVEALHARDAELGMPQGVVVANDSNTQRCYMLVHMMKRIGTPCLLATTHQAQRFPSLTRSEDTKHIPGVGWFDRVLADVPCSGDGTIRKAPNLWEDWRPGHGLILHPLQVSIALRGAMQLKVGGRMVYSTCSLNPMENEAVVAQLLHRTGGSMRVVDSSDKLPELKRSPGLTTWSVMDAKGNWVDEEELKTMETLPKAVIPTMFPPTDEAILEQLKLCWRLVPSAQNTGGFFVCVLEKVAPIERTDAFVGVHVKAVAAKRAAEDAAAAAAAADAADASAPDAKRPRVEASEAAGADSAATAASGGAGGPAGANGGAGAADEDSTVDEEVLADDAELQEAMGEKPAGKKVHANDAVAEYDYQPLSDLTWDAIRTYYELNDDFPRDSLMMRKSAAKVISWICPAVSQLFRSKMAWRLRVVHSGMRAFVRDRSKKPPKIEDRGPEWNDYRLVQHCLHLIKPYMPAHRVITMPLIDFARLLHAVSFMIPFRYFTESTQAALATQPIGSVAIELDNEGIAIVRARADGRGEEDAAALNATLGTSPVLASSQMCLAGWRGSRAVTAYVTQEHADVFVERIPAEIMEAAKLPEELKAAAMRSRAAQAGGDDESAAAPDASPMESEGGASGAGAEADADAAAGAGAS